MQVAVVRGKKFKVSSSWKEDTLTRALNNFHSGVIVVCPDCKKVDINPYKHFEQCDPERNLQKLMEAA